MIVIIENHIYIYIIIYNTYCVYLPAYLIMIRFTRGKCSLIAPTLILLLLLFTRASVDKKKTGFLQLVELHYFFFREHRAHDNTKAPLLSDRLRVCYYQIRKLILYNYTSYFVHVRI
jgi:hypothetical protein